MQPSSVQHKPSAKDRNLKEVAMRRLLPPIPKPNKKGRVNVQKEAAKQDAVQSTDLNHKQSLHGIKLASLHMKSPTIDLSKNGRISSEKEAITLNGVPTSDLNLRERVYTGSNVTFRKPNPSFDLNQDNFQNRQESPLPSRAPIFDLNEISTEEEEHQGNCEPSKVEASRAFVLSLNDEQQHDLKLSICRNAGEGSTRVGKRKISWQDPVALRV